MLRGCDVECKIVDESVKSNRCLKSKAVKVRGFKAHPPSVKVRGLPSAFANGKHGGKEKINEETSRNF